MVRDYVLAAGGVRHASRLVRCPAVSLPHRRATSTSATCAPLSPRGCRRDRREQASWSGWRTSTGPTRRPVSSNASSPTSPVSGSTGTDPVVRQSDRFARYDEVIGQLVDRGSRLSLLLHPPRDPRRRSRTSRRAPRRRVSRHLPRADRRRASATSRRTAGRAPAAHGSESADGHRRAGRVVLGDARRLRRASQRRGARLPPRGRGRRRRSGGSPRWCAATTCCRRRPATCTSSVCSVCRHLDTSMCPSSSDPSGDRLAKRDGAVTLADLAGQGVDGDVVRSCAGDIAGPRRAAASRSTSDQLVDRFSDSTLGVRRPRTRCPWHPSSAASRANDGRSGRSRPVRPG